MENVSNLSLALGSFDGIHIGHQAVIKSAVNYAKLNNIKSAVVSFVKPPVCYFRHIEARYITSSKDRNETLSNLGVDYLIELDFEQVKDLTPVEYVENILVNKLGAKAISTGFNHRFGANQKGDTKFLQQNTSRYGYEYFLIEPKIYHDEVISSTRIRQNIKLGNLEAVNNMLSRKFSISGEVVKGRQIGRQIGFPTANIIYPNNIIELPYGVYSTEVIYMGNPYKGITNYGIAPTIKNEKLAVLEVNIIDFDEDIYGQNLTVNFNKMIRKEMKFENIDQLKFQIEKDKLSV